MNFLDAFKTVDQVRSFETDDHLEQMTNYEPQYRDPMAMSQQYNLYNIQMPIYSLDGYISPYPTNNWDLSSNILKVVDDESRFPALEPKIDPNRIFTADIAALRAIAADQTRVIRMFEKRYQEAMADKAKYGLTEDDIEALQALTAARTALMNITKAQVDIRKNIADLKIKQAQQQKGPGLPNQQGMPSSSFDASKSLMDNIFAMPATPVPAESFTTNVSGTDAAAEVLDTLVPSVSQNIENEVREAVTYAVVGVTDDDVTLVTVAKDGEVLAQDKPSVHGTVNRTNYTVDFENSTSYDIKTWEQINEMGNE